MSIKKQLPSIRFSDPHFEREKNKYKHPLPSREYVAQILEEQGKPLTFQALAKLLTISKNETEAFEYRLKAMIRDGELMLNRKNAFILPDKVNLIAGYIEAHPDGYGFLIPDDGSEDLYLEPKQMRKVLHRDRVLVRETGIDRRGRREGAIIEVLERHNKEVVGRVFEEHGIRFVSAENRRICQDILIPPETGRKKSKLKIRPGQVVIVEIIEQPSRHNQPIGRIVEVLGEHADSGMEIEIALRKFDLPFQFSKEVEKEAEKIAKKVSASEIKKRVDLRALPLVTIDGETARDFDDAVYAERDSKKHWRLVVAIADVSHYVRPGTMLDQEALMRGNSVYFPRRVVPMLPEELSNGICSLNPGVERLALVCDARINQEGEVSSYQFYPAVFKSAARLTYDKVWSWLSGESKPIDSQEKSSLPHLKNLYKVFKVLLKAREKRGAIDFETTETMMLFTDDGKIENIVPIYRNDAHRVIEECMLCANICAADFLIKNKQPGLFRVHGGPTAERLANLRELLAEFGLDLPGGEAPNTKDYAFLLDQIKGRPDAPLLQTAMLRSLKQALYSPDNTGHFGLAYPYYTHFTSPIRRYPDLLVHRAINAILAGKKFKPNDYGMAAEAMAVARIADRKNAKTNPEKDKHKNYDNHEQWEGIGLHCSMTERRADEATRGVSNWLKCYYMHDRIGEEFDGLVSAVTSFGIFVTLTNVYVEGLVHISDLGEDYFNYNPIKHQLSGERSGVCYRLGDSIRVHLVRADLDTSRIDFLLAPQKTKLDFGAKKSIKIENEEPALMIENAKKIEVKETPTIEKRKVAIKKEIAQSSGATEKVPSKLVAKPTRRKKNEL